MMRSTLLLVSIIPAIILLIVLWTIRIYTWTEHDMQDTHWFAVMTVWISTILVLYSLVALLLGISMKVIAWLRNLGRDSANLR